MPTAVSNEIIPYKRQRKYQQPDCQRDQRHHLDRFGEVSSAHNRIED